MTSRTTKIQYNTFETGEFIDEKQRTYEETIALIENFPWKKQREHIEVDLSNASITMENEGGEYLKFSLYYSGKFVLYFFNTHDELFSKGFVRQEDAYPYIQSFFSSDSFEPTNFSKETTWFQHNRKHFVSNDFIYTITPKRTRAYFLKTCGLHLSFGLVFIGMFAFAGHAPLGFWIFILLMCFFIGGGLNLILFFNYYFYARGKKLIMSRGNDVFYFGTAEDPSEFNKKDIKMATTFHGEGGRSPISEFSTTKIEFNDGTDIRIPNIFVNGDDLNNKLLQCPRKFKRTFPTVDKN